MPPIPHLLSQLHTLYPLLLTILCIFQSAIETQSLSSSKSLPPLPNESHSPLDIVRFQLSALKNDDMYTVFKYASPSNKLITGPWQNFARMVRAEPYAVLVGHDRAEVLLEWGGRSGTEPYGCMVRVWPGVNVRSGGSSGSFPYIGRVGGGSVNTVPKMGNRNICVDFNWMLSQCGERDDPLFRGCWMVDGVFPRE